MKNFQTFKIRDEQREILENPFQDIKGKDSEKGRVLKVKPPRSNSGLQKSINFIKRLHTLEMKERKNVSPVSSFEIWYNNNNLSFNIYVPNEEVEIHTRKQLASFFEGVEIETNLDKFIDIEDRDYMTGCRGKLSNHYFEPVKSKLGFRSYEEDPYLSILGEIDSKDNTNVLFQTLIKPATDDWCSTPSDDVRNYADRFLGNKEISKFGGIYKYKNKPDKDESEYGESIKQQEKSLGFHVDVRCIFFGDKYSIKTESKQLENIMELEFQEITGQTLELDPVKNVEDINNLLEDMVYRKSDSLKEYMGFNDYFKEKISNTPILNVLFGYEDFMKKRIMMTPNELGGLFHLPMESDVSTDSIEWAEFSFSGEQSEGFEEFSEEEKKEYVNNENDGKESNSGEK